MTLLTCGGFRLFLHHPDIIILLKNEDWETELAVAVWEKFTGWLMVVEVRMLAPLIKYWHHYYTLISKIIATCHH